MLNHAGMDEPAAVSHMRTSDTRFAFGKNWEAFLKVLDEDRVRHAQDGLCSMLPDINLTERRFLDIGSGSGLMSLAAHRLGALVDSFDYDIDSVECTKHLKTNYAHDTERWTVLRGSALDGEFMEGLGQYDVVYSWGVLHHTGDMWTALQLAGDRVNPGGVLFIAIYNDQGSWSRRWWKIKRAYCERRYARGVIAGVIISYWILRGLAADLFWRRNPRARYRSYSGNRGMSVFHDWIDWIGGFPFEVAKPEEILDFFLSRGFHLVRLKTAGGSVGCNEFVFVRGQRPV